MWEYEVTQQEQRATDRVSQPYIDVMFLCLKKLLHNSRCIPNFDGLRLAHQKVYPIGQKQGNGDIVDLTCHKLKKLICQDRKLCFSTLLL